MLTPGQQPVPGGTDEPGTPGRPAFPGPVPLSGVMAAMTRAIISRLPCAATVCKERWHA
jgi:hypothetical protein